MVNANRTPFETVQFEELDSTAKEFMKKINVLGRAIRSWNVWVALRVSLSFVNGEPHLLL